MRELSFLNLFPSKTKFFNFLRISSSSSLSSYLSHLSPVDQTLEHYFHSVFIPLIYWKAEKSTRCVPLDTYWCSFSPCPLINQNELSYDSLLCIRSTDWYSVLTLRKFLLIIQINESSRSVTGASVCPQSVHFISQLKTSILFSFHLVNHHSILFFFIPLNRLLQLSLQFSTNYSIHFLILSPFYIVKSTIRMLVSFFSSDCQYPLNQ